MPSRGPAKKHICPSGAGSGLRHLYLPAPGSQALFPRVVAALRGITALPFPSPGPLGNR